tara:strand:- start:253 stop:492 length:240 start_codon:yes stop_codon:yes gene_type:complete
MAELDDLFEEMFGEKKEEVKEEQPQKPSEKSEWSKLETIPKEEPKGSYKPSGLRCSRCSSNDASYSPYYDDQWCLNCWF